MKNIVRHDFKYDPVDDLYYMEQTPNGTYVDFTDAEKEYNVVVRQRDYLSERLVYSESELKEALYDSSLMKRNLSRFVVDMCDFGHEFVKVAGHPMRDGKPQCPNCMSIGLEKWRNAEIVGYISYGSDYFNENGTVDCSLDENGELCCPVVRKY